MPDHLSDKERHTLDEFYKHYRSKSKMGKDSTARIDVVFPESVRKSMGEYKILEYALDHSSSLMISVCAEGKEVQIINDWVKIPDDLAEGVLHYKDLSHGICPVCAEKLYSTILTKRKDVYNSQKKDNTTSKKKE